MTLPAISVRYTLDPPARCRALEHGAGDVQREVQVTQTEPSSSFRHTFERLPRRPPKLNNCKDVELSDSVEQTCTVIFVMPDGQKVATEVGNQLKIAEVKARLAASLCSGAGAASPRIVCRGSILQDDRSLASCNVVDGTELRILTCRPSEQRGGAVRKLLVTAPRGMLMVPSG
mmetsp:Transcript_12434/g.28180  ORF Transcript_12434/g.28180 Transcript_12434/m.28180 type:complete len:174 (+) Transcript_12434:75-596(+)